MSNADTLTLDQALQQAVAHHRAGQLQDAERLYRAILQAQPQHPDANHNLGVLAVGVGKVEAALPFFQAALATHPKVEQFWLSHVDALLRLGRHKPARKAINSARRQGIPAKTIDTLKASLHTALREPPAAAQKPPPTQPDREQQQQLADLFQQGRFVEMEAAARAMIRDFPAFSFGWETLAPALKSQRRLPEAIAAYRQALQLNPQSTMTLSNFANCLNEAGLHEEAIIQAKRALELDGNYVAAHINLGNAYQALGDDDAGLQCYRQALALNPAQAEAHNNIGAILLRDEQVEDAEHHINQALSLRHDYSDALSNQGRILTNKGVTEVAQASFEHACQLEPANIEFELLARLLLPKIPASPVVIDHWRRRYQNGIDSLLAHLGQFDKPGEKHAASYFYLAYHDADDRPIVEALCRLFRAKSPSLHFVASHLTDWQPPTDRRLRIGFCSQFLVGHTIGKLYQGFLQQLDRTRFEVTLIHAPKAKRDAFSATLDQCVDRVVQLPHRLAEQQRLVAEAQFDVLFYPDIGMSPSTYFLAYARLAPVQVVSWGHPDTTGLDTLDYFVSAAGIEPEDADEHYSERLIRLNRLPCFYQPLMAPTQIPARAALGLPETGTLYGCPQSLFKFHPDFDAVLADIAAGDPAGHIVVLGGLVGHWSVLLRERWANSAPILNERVIFLPRVPLDRFMALMAHFDVLLDPIHFGSGNTLYEAMVYGKPIITWPGRFMRGRIVAGAYRQMDLADAPIAARIEDYAPLALALGKDAARRQALREAFRQNAGKLFADTQAVREFETFLEAAIAVAGRGEKLPPGWQPESGAA